MMIFLKITDLCMLQCRYCFYNTDYLERKERNVTSNWPNWLPFLKYFEVNQIILTGGDPLSPQFFGTAMNMVDFFVSQGINVSIDSSLAISSKMHLQRLAISSFDHLYVSCDAHIGEIHNLQRGKWQETISAIKFLLRHNKNVYINCALTKFNYQYIREIYDFFTDMHVAGVDFNMVYLPEKHLLFEQLSCHSLSITAKKQLAKDLIWWASQSTRHPNRMHYALYQSKELLDDSINLPVNPVCQMGADILVVDQFGDVSPCFHLTTSFGNIENISGIKKQQTAIKTNPYTCHSQRCTSLFAIESFWPKEVLNEKN